MNTADQIRVAELTGAARHHAKWRPLTADEHAVAVAALRQLAGEGKTVAQITQATGLSPAGVRHHLHEAGAAAARPDRAAKVSQKRAQVGELADLSVAGVRHHLAALGVSAARADRSGQVSPAARRCRRWRATARTPAEIAGATGLSVAGVRHHLKALRQAT